MGVELKELRCINCGAPLPPVDKEIVTCEFCGYSQKRIEVNKYMEDIKSEVFSWIKNLIPSYTTAAQSVQDSVARHNLFIFNVKPAITGDFLNTKNKLLMLLSSPMISNPFNKHQKIRLPEISKTAFENSLKMKGLEPLAVVDEDKVYLNDVISTYASYAYILNGIQALNQRKFDLAKRNFENALNEFKDKEHRKVEYSRLVGIVSLLSGIIDFYNDLRGNLSIINTFADAIKNLETAKNLAMQYPSASPMIPAIEKEIVIARTIQNIVATVVDFTELGYDTSKLLNTFEIYHNILYNVHSTQTNRSNIEYMVHELSNYVQIISKSKKGEMQIKIIGGEGSLLVPFWVVGVTYTFTTGVWFAKKGKVIEDTLLVSTTYPVSGDRSFTDIFSLRSTTSVWTRISGKEKTLTLGQLTKLIATAKLSTLPSSRFVVLPLIGRKYAENVANTYIKKVSLQLRGKIKFGAGRAKHLIYLPANISGEVLTIPSLESFNTVLENSRLLKNLAI